MGRIKQPKFELRKVTTLLMLYPNDKRMKQIVIKKESEMFKKITEKNSWKSYCQS